MYCILSMYCYCWCCHAFLCYVLWLLLLINLSKTFPWIWNHKVCIFFEHPFLFTDVWSETSPHRKSTREEVKEQHDRPGVLHEVWSSQLRPRRVHQLPEESGRRRSLRTRGKRQVHLFFSVPLQVHHVYYDWPHLSHECSFWMFPYDNKMQLGQLQKRLINFLPSSYQHHSSLVSPPDKRPGQMQHANNQIWSRHGSGPSSE